MEDIAAPPPSDLDLLRQREFYLDLVRKLYSMLPFDRRASDEERERMGRAALAQLAAMAPANADEADLAAHYVAATAHATDCLRTAVRNTGYHDCVEGLRKQAGAMLREARGHRSLLLRVQTARLKRDTDDTARERDAWTAQSAMGLMMQAFEPEVVEPEAAVVAEPEVVAAPEPVAEADAEPKVRSELDLKVEAEYYAIHYPRRARLIRKLGGVPPDCDFGPPDPELVKAIINGTTTALRSSDKLAGA